VVDCNRFEVAISKFAASRGWEREVRCKGSAIELEE
jgi:hypothetical protein